MEILIWPPYTLTLSVSSALLAVSAVSFVDVVLASFVSFASGVVAGSGALSFRFRRLPHALRGSVGDGRGSSGVCGSCGRCGSFSRWRDG